MKKNTAYILTGLSVLVVLIIGYHYYAAAQAEEQISKGINEFSKKNNDVSLQITSVDVEPFAADITIRDVNVISADHIERTKQLRLNVSYWDILRGYFGGVEYGLRHLSNLKIQALKPSYTKISGPQEFKADTLNLNYDGYLMEGIEALANNKKLDSDITLTVNAVNTVAVLPAKSRTTIKAKHFKYRTQLSNGSKLAANRFESHAQASQIIWSPSQATQQQYSFIIKGLGYPVDAIPFKSARLAIQPDSVKDKISLNAALSSELALMESSGNIQLRKPLGDTKISDAQVTVSDFSEKFSNILKNFEQLFDISFNRSKDGVHLKLEGTLGNPTIKR